MYATHDGEVYPLPINLGTINQFFRAALHARRGEATDRRTGRRTGRHRPDRTSTTRASQLIGRPLYEAFIKNYTGKQWQTDPAELPAGIIKRLPVRFNYDNRYFKDTWEGLPRDGYTAWMERMIDDPRIHVTLGDRLLRREPSRYNKKALARRRRAGGVHRVRLTGISAMNSAT